MCHVARCAIDTCHCQERMDNDDKAIKAIQLAAAGLAIGGSVIAGAALLKEGKLGDAFGKFSEAGKVALENKGLV